MKLKNILRLMKTLMKELFLQYKIIKLKKYHTNTLISLVLQVAFSNLIKY